jgi:PST family polysaccharide transporter
MIIDGAASDATAVQAADGSRYTLLTQLARIACKAISVVIVARLVTPADHGIYAMAASVTLLLFLFLDLGLGTAVIQSPQLRETQSTTLLCAHLLIGASLALLTLCAAPFVARFYATPAVTPVLVAMSAGLLINAAGGMPRAMLARQLRFRAINQLETTAAVLGTAAMIAAAALNAGPYTFVVFLLVSESTTALLAWRICEWRPSPNTDFAAAQPILRTGWRITRYHLINYFVQQTDTVAVGQFFGSHAVGLYNRALQMLTLPLLHVAGPLSRLAIAVLSRLPPGSAAFAQQGLVSTNVIAHLTLPLAAFAIATPEELVRLVLGQQWPAAAPLLRWMAVSAAIHQITYIGHALCIVSDQSRRLTWMAAAGLPFVIAAILLGARHGVVGIATALAVANAALALPRLAWMLQDTPVRVGAFVRALLLPVAFSIALGVGALLGRDLVIASSWPVRICGIVIGAAVMGGAALVVSSRLRREIRRVFAHLPGRRETLPSERAAD